jgi:vitamin B12 transporter
LRFRLFRFHLAWFFIFCGAGFFENESQAAMVTTDYEKPLSERIVVSPKRTPEKISRTSENITVLTAEDIRWLPATDPSEAISYLSGVDVTVRTKFGHFSPLSMQGASSRHVLVMVDGIPFNTQASGQADILSALPLDNIKQIEIIKGAASSAWGSSLGGLINIVTKDPVDSLIPKGSVSTSAAEFGTRRQNGEISGTAGGWGYFFSGDYLLSGGARTKGNVRNKEDTLRKKFFGKLSRAWTEVVKMAASFGYSGAEINEGVYPTNGNWSHIPYYARYGQFRLDLDPEDRRHLEAVLQFNRQLIVTDTLRGSNDSFVSTVKSQDHMYGLNLKSVTRHRQEDVLVVGADISGHTLKSSQMDQARDIFMQSPYANYTLSLAPFDIIGGIRYDWNDEFGDQLNPSIGGVFHLPWLPNTLIRGNISRAFHPPPLLWRFFEDVTPGVTANNPDIKPERAWVYEAGVETEAISNLWVKFSVFRSYVRDAIVTAVNSQGLFSKQNVQKFRQKGFELESRLKASEELVFSFGGVYNEVEDLETGLPVTGRGVGKPSFKIGLYFQNPQLFNASFFANYNRWDSPASARANDRKFIFDAKLSKEIVKKDNFTVSCFVTVYNLTNSKYWSSINFPIPERYGEVGVTIDF